MFDFDEVPDEVLEELEVQRAQRRRLRHWCDTCHGRTGPGSPCYEEADSE